MVITNARGGYSPHRGQEVKTEKKRKEIEQTLQSQAPSDLVPTTSHSPIIYESIDEHIAEVKVTPHRPHFRTLLHWRPSFQYRVEDLFLKSQSLPGQTFVTLLLSTDKLGLRRNSP